MPGCNKNTLEVEQASNQSTQPTQASQEAPVSPTPSEQPVQPTTTPSNDLTNKDAEFYIEENKIYKKTADEVTAIYDPAVYYEPDTSSAINTLLIDEEALFFKEWNGGAGYDDGFSSHSIVRLDKGGENRQVLVSMTSPYGYHDLISFQNRLVYVEECGDSYFIEDVSKDGSNQDIIDFDAYSAHYDAYSGFFCIDFYEKDECLYADLSLYCKDWSSPSHTVRIDKDFNIERTLPEQDEYYIGGSKIYKNAAHSDEKVLIYDANGFYSKENAYVGYLQATDDSLYFMESGYDENLGYAVSSIIQTDTDGNNRHLIYYSTYNISIQPVFFDGKIYFADGYHDMDCIGRVEDGELVEYVCFREYAKQHGFNDTDNISISLSIEDGELIATVGFDYHRETHILKISEDLSFERIE